VAAAILKAAVTPTRDVKVEPAHDAMGARYRPGGTGLVYGRGA